MPTVPRRAWLAALVLVLGLASVSYDTSEQAAALDLPARFSDREFWSMVQGFSEPNGFFDSDNLVSNEDEYQTVIPELTGSAPRGAYLGVGPDQNFAYIIALDPPIAFITDIRRGNLHVHLMYKALIEQSADRADFLARLFSRPRPPNLPAGASADALFAAFRQVKPDRALYDRNLRAMLAWLTSHHGFTLAQGDAAGIASIYAQFFGAGPSLRFVSSRGGSFYPSYEDLQIATDGQGVNRGYLGSEAAYARLRAIEEGNRIVPLVGDFAGAKALRSVGTFLESHGAAVGVFYTSNVERYLFQNGSWPRFLANVAALPFGPSSLFIRSCFDTCSSSGGSRAVSLIGPMGDLVRDAQAGRVVTYRDVLRHGHSH
jgi:hypothetical protein